MAQIVKKENRLATVRDLLERMRPQLANAAPEHLKPSKILRVAMTAIQKTPKLLDCTDQSILGCIMQSTQLGLEVDGVAQLAHLVPFKNQCTLILGYRGLIQLAMRSGHVIGIQPCAVYRDDVFEPELGTAMKLKHVPNFRSKNRTPDDIIAVYAVALLNGNNTQFEIMTREDIERVRMQAKAGKDGPWVTHWEAMALKTVIRRLCKYLPASAELATAVTLDEQAELGIDQGIDFVDVETVEDSRKVGRPRKKTVEDLVPKEPSPEARKQVEKLNEITELRNSITSGYEALDENSQAMFRQNVSIGDIADLVMETDADVLRSMKDALLSV